MSHPAEMTVEFVSLERLTSCRDRSDAFALRPDRPAVPLQHLCLWVLAKLGARARTEVVTTRRLTIPSSDGLMEGVFRQRHELVRMCAARPSRLIIGAEDWARYMGRGEAPDVPFAYEAGFRHGEPGCPLRSFALTVEVVPCLRGFVVLPEPPPILRRPPP